MQLVDATCHDLSGQEWCSFLPGRGLELRLRFRCGTGLFGGLT